MNHQPSLWKIALNDYIAFLGWVFPVALGAMYTLFVVMGEVEFGFRNFLAAIFTVIAVLSLIVFVLRVRFFYAVFSDNLEATAMISNLTFFRDRGRVEYVYMFQGQKYLGGNAILKTKQTQELSIGESVVVLVDRNHPKRAFIRDLYE